VGLRINKDKTKTMEVKTFSPQTIMLANCATDKVQDFKYLGSVISTAGTGTDQDVEARLGKATSTF